MQDPRLHVRQLRKYMTLPERALWAILRNRDFHGFKFRRQVPLGSYIVDFLCLSARLIVELDGRGHRDEKAYDEQRTRWLESQGFRVLRFWNWELETEPERVKETIFAQLTQGAVPPHPPAPSPARGEGEI